MSNPVQEYKDHQISLLTHLLGGGKLVNAYEVVYISRALIIIDAEGAEIKIQYSSLQNYSIYLSPQDIEIKEMKAIIAKQKAELLMLKGK